MQERIIRLEGDVGRMKADVAELRIDVGTIKVDLATLSERVAHLPSKPWMFQAFGVLLASIVGLVTLVVGLIVRFLPHAS